MLNRPLPIASTINIVGGLFLIAKIGWRRILRSGRQQAKKAKAAKQKIGTMGLAVFRCRCTDLHEDVENSSRDSNNISSRSNVNGSNGSAVAVDTHHKNGRRSGRRKQRQAAAAVNTKTAEEPVAAEQYKQRCGGACRCFFKPQEDGARVVHTDVVANVRRWLHPLYFFIQTTNSWTWTTTYS